jgi:hypothetical protein
MQIINEECDSKVKTNLKIGAAFGDASNEKNASNFIKGSGPDEVEDLENPEEAPKELTSDVDSSLKKVAVKKESTNPFDALFNKIVSEETFDFSTEDDNEIEPSDAFEDTTMGLSDEEAEEDLAEFDDEDESEDEDSVTLTIDKETAEKLIDLLQSALGMDSEEEGEFPEEGESEEEEGESEEGEEEGGEEGESEEEGEFPEEGEDETLSKESFAIDEADDVNVDAAVKKLTSKNSHKVEGTLSKVKRKSAKVPSTGKGSNKPLKQHNTKPAVSSLTKKKQDVKGSNMKKGDEYFK